MAAVSSLGERERERRTGMDGARCRSTRGGEFIRSASKNLTPFSRRLSAIQSIGVIF